MCVFSLCAAEKAEAKVKVSKPNTAEKRRLRILLQSLRDSSLSEGAFDLCVFSLCAAEKTGRKFKALEPKICTFSFCGSAARHYMPSSGRKVSRVSVTKGAGGTERRQKAVVFRCLNVNPSPASREPPLPQGSHESVQFSALCRRESRGKSKSFKAEYGRKTQVAHSPSVALRQLPLGGSL